MLPLLDKDRRFDYKKFRIRILAWPYSQKHRIVTSRVRPSCPSTLQYMADNFAHLNLRYFSKMVLSDQLALGKGRRKLHQYAMQRSREMTTDS